MKSVFNASTIEEHENTVNFEEIPKKDSSQVFGLSIFVNQSELEQFRSESIKKSKSVVFLIDKSKKTFNHSTGTQMKISTIQ